MSDANNIASTLGLNVTVNTLGTAMPLLGEIDIVALPPDLQNLDEIQSLSGKILSVQKDGQVLISTELGNVTIGTNNNAAATTLLQNKKEVELRIEAGNPPRKIVLRPIAREIPDIAKTEKIDVPPVQTILTDGAKALKPMLLDMQQILAAMPVKMTLLSSEEPISQPFMQTINVAIKPPNIEMIRSYDSAAYDSDVLPEQILGITKNAVLAHKSGGVLENNFPYQERVSYPAANMAQMFDSGDAYRISSAKTKTITLPLQNTDNTASLPFRAVAVQIIGTSESTRLSCWKKPQALMTDTRTVARGRDVATPDITIARHAEIRVRNISPPQVQFISDDVSAKIQNAQNLYFSPIRYAENNSSDIVLGEQIGVADAVVEGFTQTRGLPVLHIITPKVLSGRLYSLDIAVRGLQVGSRLEFEISTASSYAGNMQNDIANNITDKSAFALDSSNFPTLGNWPIMEEIQQSLAMVSEQSAQAFNASLPSVASPMQLGSAVLFFIAAMRSGDVQSWLGERVVDELRRSGKSSLLERLGNELSGISRMNEEHISGKWRALSVPIAWQNDIHKLVIYTNSENERTPDGEDENIGKGRKIRFVVDLSLSHIGSLQLDGLFSGASGGDGASKASGRLDLILRTEKSFSQAMKQQMRVAYKNALDETQITGDLSFQDHRSDWVRITPSDITEYSVNI